MLHLLAFTVLSPDRLVVPSCHRCEWAKHRDQDREAGPGRLARRAPVNTPTLPHGKDVVLNVGAKRFLPSHTGWRAIGGSSGPCMQSARLVCVRATALRCASAR